jgi:ferredoxin
MERAKDNNKVKVMLIFPKMLAAEPISYHLVKDYDLKINILKAYVNYNVEGRLLLELEGTDANIKQGLKYLKSLDIKTVLNGTGTYIDFDKCVACGACIAACETGALRLEDDRLVFDGTKCLECRLCEKACPERLIKNVFNGV